MKHWWYVSENQMINVIPFIYRCLMTRKSRHMIHRVTATLMKKCRIGPENHSPYLLTKSKLSHYLNPEMIPIWKKPYTMTQIPSYTWPRPLTYDADIERTGRVDHDQSDNILIDTWSDTLIQYLYQSQIIQFDSELAQIPSELFTRSLSVFKITTWRPAVMSKCLPTLSKIVRISRLKNK